MDARFWLKDAQETIAKVAFVTEAPDTFWMLCHWLCEHSALMPEPTSDDRQPGTVITTPYGVHIVAGHGEWQLNILWAAREFAPQKGGHVGVHITIITVNSGLVTLSDAIMPIERMWEWVHRAVLEGPAELREEGSMVGLAPWEEYPPFGDWMRENIARLTAVSRHHESIAARFAELHNIKRGWFDGTTGEVPSALHFARVQAVLVELSNRPGLEKPHVYPTPEGGLQAEWDAPWGTVNMEFMPDGLIEATTGGAEAGSALGISFNHTDLIRLLGEWAVPSKKSPTEEAIDERVSELWKEKYGHLPGWKPFTEALDDDTTFVHEGGDPNLPDDDHNSRENDPPITLGEYALHNIPALRELAIAQLTLRHSPGATVPTAWMEDWHTRDDDVSEKSDDAFEDLDSPDQDEE